MAKFCGKCGAQLSDEMIFCNKCGARYRAPQAQASQPAPTQQQGGYSAPVPPAQGYAGAYNPPAPGKSTNPMWLVAIVLTIASILIFALAPTITYSAKAEATYQGQSAEETLEESDAGKIFEIVDTEEVPTEQLSYYGIDADTYQDAVDQLDTAKIIAIAVCVVGGIGVILLVLPIVNKNMKPTVAFGAVVAHVLMLGLAALVAFVMIKNAMADLTEVGYNYALTQYGAYGSVDVSIGLGVWGWVFACAVALAILATIRAVQSSKPVVTPTYTVPQTY